MISTMISPHDANEKLAFSRNTISLDEVPINQSLNNPLHPQDSQRKVDEFLESSHTISFQTANDERATHQELNLVSSISLWIPPNVHFV